MHVLLGGVLLLLSGNLGSIAEPEPRPALVEATSGTPTAVRLWAELFPARGPAPVFSQTDSRAAIRNPFFADVNGAIGVSSGTGAAMGSVYGGEMSLGIRHEPLRIALDYYEDMKEARDTRGRHRVTRLRQLASGVRLSTGEKLRLEAGVGVLHFDASQSWNSADPRTRVSSHLEGLWASAGGSVRTAAGINVGLRARYSAPARPCRAGEIGGIDLAIVIGFGLGQPACPGVCAVR